MISRHDHIVISMKFGRSEIFCKLPCSSGLCHGLQVILKTDLGKLSGGFKLVPQWYGSNVDLQAATCEWNWACPLGEIEQIFQLPYILASACVSGQTDADN